MLQFVPCAGSRCSSSRSAVHAGTHVAAARRGRPAVARELHQLVEGLGLRPSPGAGDGTPRASSRRGAMPRRRWRLEFLFLTAHHAVRVGASRRQRVGRGHDRWNSPAMLRFVGCTSGDGGATAIMATRSYFKYHDHWLAHRSLVCSFAGRRRLVWGCVQRRTQPSVDVTLLKEIGEDRRRYSLFGTHFPHRNLEEDRRSCAVLAIEPARARATCFVHVSAGALSCRLAISGLVLVAEFEFT